MQVCKYPLHNSHSYNTATAIYSNTIPPCLKKIHGAVCASNKGFWEASTQCVAAFFKSHLCPLINCQTPTSAKYIVINCGKYNRLALKVIISIINMKQVWMGERRHKGEVVEGLNGNKCCLRKVMLIKMRHLVYIPAHYG